MSLTNSANPPTLQLPNLSLSSQSKTLKLFQHIEAGLKSSLIKTVNKQHHFISRNN